MIICNKCNNEFFINDLIFGDGVCEKHGGFAFSENNLEILCEECAKEKNKCQRCGESL